MKYQQKVMVFDYISKFPSNNKNHFLKTVKIRFFDRPESQFKKWVKINKLSERVKHDIYEVKKIVNLDAKSWQEVTKCGM